MLPPRPRRRANALAPLLVLLVLAPSARAATPDAVPGEILVKYRAGVPDAARAAVRAALPGARVLARLELIGGERLDVAAVGTDAALAALARDPRIEYAEPNRTVSASVIPNDPLLGQLWGLRNTGQGGAYAGDDIHATQAWDLYTGDANLLIGVTDTGIDWTHPDLAANVWTNPGEIPGNGIDDDHDGYVDDVHGWNILAGTGSPMDDNGHGTHVAGTIGAVGNDGAGIVGVNWHCKLVAIKFLDATGNGSEADAILALQYAVAVGCRVTNASWGNMSGGQALLDAIDAAGRAGQLFVNSAGNNGWLIDNVPVYPTCYATPYMITVTATDGRDLRPSWANYGPLSVNLGAPGVGIYSAKPGATYQTLQGTSMAAPHVTGAVALAMGRFPHASNLVIRQLVLSNTDPVASMAATTSTGGRLDAYKVLLNGDATPPGRIADLVRLAADTTSLVLGWTATGNDSTAGTAAAYEFRWSATPFDSSGFTKAAAETLPPPQAAGAAEIFTVTGLAPGTATTFAIRAVDGFGNAGPVSNILTAWTATPAQLAVDGVPDAGLALRLASPNPGAGAVRFELRLPAAARADVDVLDAGGRLVRRLAAGALAAGPQALAWDGLDARGAPAGPGVYFVRVRAAGSALGRRFALLR